MGILGAITSHWNSSKLNQTLAGLIKSVVKLRAAGEAGTLNASQLYYTIMYRMN